MTAGHGDLFIPPHYPHRAPVADSPDECRKLVRQWARAGVDGIKIFTSGGVLSIGDKVGWRNQTKEEIATTVDEAHALGLLVAAHTHTAEGVDIALEFGVDSIEHGTGILERHWEELISRGIPVAPTLMINDAIAERRIPVSDEAQEKGRAVVDERDANFAAASAAGVRFVLGTDANGIFVRFGDQLEELRLMKRAFDWSSERTLRAGTSDAADAIRLTGTTGRITQGLGADFVVVRGRPWEDIDRPDDRQHRRRGSPRRRRLRRAAGLTLPHPHLPHPHHPSASSFGDHMSTFSRRRSRRLAVPAGVAAVAFVLAGCAAGGSDAAETPAADVAQDIVFALKEDSSASTRSRPR